MTTIDRARLEELLLGLVRAGGSALHLMPGRAPWIRLEGRVLPVSTDPIDSDELQELLRDFLFADHRRRLELGEEVEVLFATSTGVRFRTAVLSHVDGMNIVFRRVPDRAPDFDDAGLSAMLSTFAAFRDGLLLLTGFRGSGKRTTLAALVERINHERAAHIVTIERQIEFVHTTARSLIHQREIGTHVASVADGVRQAMLQAADVIVVDDLTDADGLRAALDAVESGKLVIACYEASGVVGVIAELPGLVPSNERSVLRRRLASDIRAVVSQTLVRRRHGRGQVPLLEVLLHNESVARAIRRGRHDQLPELMMRGSGLGMQTTDMALRSMLHRHIVSAEEAAWHADDRDWVLAR